MSKQALLIGIEEYESGSGISRLKYACRDVYGVGRALKVECGFDQLSILADRDDADFGMSRMGEPTDSAILTALKDAAARLKEEDTFFMLFVGHGVERRDGEVVRVCLLARNANLEEDCGLIEMPKLRRALSRVACRYRAVFLDCSRNDPEAGKGDGDNLMGEFLARNIEEVFTREEKSAKTTILMTSCRSGQRAYEWDVKEHGVFSFFLLQGIAGAAWRDNMLEARDLCAYVERELARWAKITGTTQESEFKQLESAQPVVLAVRGNKASSSGAEAPPMPPDSIQVLGDDCDFRLAYNVARVFLLGARSAFNFRVEPCGEDCAAREDVRIRLEVPNHAALEDAVHFGHRVRRRDLDLPFKTEEHGVDIPAKVFLSYRKAGVQRRFEGLVKWDCLPAGQAARAIENLTIQLQGISADRAARQNIHVLEGLATMQPESRAKQLLALKLAPVWQSVPLVDVSHLPSPPPTDAVVSRLTLTFGGQRFHLLSGPCIRLGKERGNDLVCRRFDAKGAPDAALTQPISRQHARLELENRRVLLTDGAEGGPSSHGTLLNGQRLPNGGPGKPLPPNTPCRITLVAPRGPGDRDPLHLDAILYLGGAVADAETPGAAPFGDPDAPACAVVTRTDNIPETFIVVWQGCPMWFVDERLCGLTIHRRSDAFWYVLPNASGWLRPGARLNLAAGPIRAGEHQQYGLDRHWWVD